MIIIYFFKTLDSKRSADHLFLPVTYDFKNRQTLKITDGYC
jgi:hypothetical protein